MGRILPPILDKMRKIGLWTKDKDGNFIEITKEKESKKHFIEYNSYKDVILIRKMFHDPQDSMHDQKELILGIPGKFKECFAAEKIRSIDGKHTYLIYYPKYIEYPQKKRKENYCNYCQYIYNKARDIYEMNDYTTAELNLEEDNFYILTQYITLQEYNDGSDATIHCEVTAEKVENGLFRAVNMISKPIFEIYKGICVTPDKNRYAHRRYKINDEILQCSKQICPNITSKTPLPRTGEDGRFQNLLLSIEKLLYPEQLENIKRFKKYRCFRPFIGSSLCWSDGAVYEGKAHHLEKAKEKLTKEEFIKLCNKFFI